VAVGSTAALICDTGALLDVRHFAAVRLRDGSSFELVVHPTDPDRP